MADPVDVTIEDNPDESRYEAIVDGQVAGIAEYRLEGPRIVLQHTEVDDAYEGKGVGSRLARGVLDAARSRDLRVVPVCPFMTSYIERHEQYADLVDS
jgi:predicted GNAT family acetyltransferase